jgi:FixJ family two-component response regulator
MSDLERKRANRQQQLTLQAEPEGDLPELKELVRETRVQRKANRTTSAPVIHVVDDDESFRVAIARLLRAVNYEVRTYANAGDFLLRQGDDAPGCILLDLRMPGPSGLALQEALANRPEQLPIIFLSGHGDIRATVRAMQAGAIDFLTKPVQRKDLLGAIDKALARDAENRVIRERLGKWRARFGALTPFELQVFERVVAGRMNKEIAAELDAAERTIKAHRAQMMEKMGCESVAELVQIAHELRTRSTPVSQPRA